MNFSVFITIWLSAASSMALNDHFLGDPLSWLKANPDVAAVEIYQPLGGPAPKTPRKGDVPPPTLMIEVQMDSLEKANALTGDAAFRHLFVEKSGVLEGAEKISVESLEVVNYDVPGHDAPPPRTAPLSFVVRYHGPVKNAAAFTEYYTSSHPALLARFPKIRNVLCYLPPGWRERGELTDDTLIHGNEAVFDSFDDFKAIGDSQEMQAVRENAAKFAEFGYASHTPMMRERVYQR